MNILTDEEMKQIHSETFGKGVQSFARAIESAVLSKLAEQDVEPIYIEATCELQNWKWMRVSKTSAEEYAKWGWKIRKLYTETQLLAAQQRTAEACAKFLGAIEHPGCELLASSIRNGDWREYL